jgi:hypothetical protein
VWLAVKKFLANYDFCSALSALLGEPAALPAIRCPNFTVLFPYGPFQFFLVFAVIASIILPAKRQRQATAWRKKNKYWLSSEKSSNR